MPASRTPRITVITPNLNGDRYLERALCSVIDQGYERLEYLVADGGSTDASVPIIRFYEDEIDHWSSREDRGPADAINQAIRRATGEWVLVVASDDLLLPGALHTVAADLATADGDWCVAHAEQIGPGDNGLGHATPAPAASLAEQLAPGASDPPLAATFFRRSLFETHGYFDPEQRYAYAYEFTCRLLADGLKPTVLQRSVVAHRSHDASLTARNVFAHGREYIDTSERYADLLPLEDRYALWAGCDDRRRLYALAEAESHASDARAFLWRQLLKRPAWVADEHYRRTLLTEIAHPLPAANARRRSAAA